MGLKLEAPPAPHVHGIWPENVYAFNVFGRMRKTQWRVAGMGGLLGLDYTSLPFFLDLEGVPPSQRVEVVDMVQAMESEAMRLFDEAKAK
ncbi:Phage related hypothetical protein (DUF1799) [Polaromonas sp. CF318]|uniref:DUF1799 domain-containing protein n=1 Tax=Polaromonas sp. CF318 TaxID=1144318 RepID=UPI000271451E|nr:DUF1799 domain-containing protein [Polaromonas sp. CF318]EJL77359.1 Phage related hypothetical protein (DUF1799) [Polaromonas sp. CF318]